MARIRIVDDWLRSPASPPSHYRSIMVVAEQWAEQRVLMRAYAESRDQTRPTIVLHGEELAIGPAGTDAHGPWGIHVQPPADGRAQELLQQLEVAARRMAGARGSPPRLADEIPAFERKATNNWAPGAPRDAPGSAPRPYFEPAVAASQRMAAAMGSAATGAAMAYGTPAPGQHHSGAAQASAPQAGTPHAGAPHASTPHASTPQAGAAQFQGQQMATGGVERLPVAPAAQVVPRQPAAQLVVPPRAETGASGPVAEYVSPSALPAPPSVVAAPSDVPELRLAAVPVSARSRPRTAPPATAGARTALGYSSGSGAQSAVMRLGLRPGVSQRLGRIVERTVPPDFEVSPIERAVLNALGEADHLTARAIGNLIGVADPLTWMDRLMDKLARHGLDIVAPGEPDGGEPTYVLRR